MEEDRYQKNHLLFIISLVSLLISLVLFAFTLYMLPHLLFGWRYDAPEFIPFWTEWLQYQYNVSEAAASKLILFLFVLLSLIFGLITYFSSNRIENQIFSSGLSGTNKSPIFKKSTREGVALGLKIFFIIIIIFVAASLLQWLIYHL